MRGILVRICRARAKGDPMVEGGLYRLAQRSPFCVGVYNNNHDHLGQTRLATVVLTDSGRPPITSHDGHYVVTYNGETYNHLKSHTELGRWSVEDIVDSGLLPTNAPGILASTRDRLEDAVKMTIRGGQLVIKGILDARKIEEALLKIANQEWPRLFIIYKLVLQETWFRKVVAT